MSHPVIKTACVVAGFAVAALAATSAHAAKPLTIQQKASLAEAMARNYNGNSKAPPKTAAKAVATLTVAAGGGESVQVPEELYVYLGASPDANGHMHVRDIDPNAESVSIAVEASDEK